MNDMFDKKFVNLELREINAHKKNVIYFVFLIYILNYILMSLKDEAE